MSQPPRTAKDIFLAALDTDPARRATLVEELCAGDAALGCQVEALLRAHDQPDSFLDSPRIDLGLSDDCSTTKVDLTVDGPNIEGPGDVIGPYRLLRMIGEGGFGVVYMAEQNDPVERRVALKIIKPGMHSRQVIARFRAEEQALAMMDHPNIARVFEAGVTGSGRPYFVMELVNGVPITQFCDQHHLTPRERLGLFVPVCQAIQHAHQKGIIHRDLKPSNVLVAEYDDRPVPKVIDFGVAKAIQRRLSEETMFTQFGQMIGTIDYMSPEQAKLNEMDIDTRSDVYSLGVLLYELLIGETPFDRGRLHSAAFEELLRIIREEEPPRPSLRLSSSPSLPSIAANRHTEPKRLSTLVRGELDWIVMKALEKDRSRRYETANGLANDIERYLNDEPVVACPPSAVYRFRKFTRRNKAFLTTIALVAAALVLGIIGTSWQAIRATSAKRLAGERLVAEQSAREEANRAWHAEAEQRLLAEQERDRAEMNLKLANAEQQRAEGNLDLALAALDAIYLKAFGRDKLLAEAVAGSGQPERRLPQERPPPGESDRRLLKRGLSFYDQFAEKNAAAPHAFVRTAQAYFQVGLIQGALGDAAAAVEAYRGAIERFKRLTKEEPGNAEHFRGLADAYLFQGHELPQWSEASAALQNARLAYSDAIRLRPDDPTLYLLRGLALYALNDAGAGEDFSKVVQLDPQNLESLLLCAKYYRRDFPKARAYAERALAVAPQDPRCHIALANVLGEVDFGGLHPRVNAVEALEHYDRAIELAPNFYGAYYARGAFHFFNQDHPRALADLGRALELKPGDDSALLKRARALTELGEYDKALADLSAIAGLKRNAGFVDGALGDIYLKKEDWQAAVDAFTKVVEIDPASWSVFKRRALAYAHLGQYAQALADLKRALELKPDETSTLAWIPPRLVAACPDQSFRQGLFEVAESAVEKSPNRVRALQDRATLLYVRFSEWEKARADLEKVLQSPGADPDASYQFALLCLILNDAPKYRDACATMVQKFGKTDNPVAANFVVWTCALAPDAVKDYEPVVACATKAVEAQPDSDQFANTLGAILYRADRHEAAIEWLTEATRALQRADAEESSAPAYTWYFLAMAYRTTGNDQGAQEALNKANQSMDQELAGKPDQISWNRRATLELLRKEAEALLAAPAAGPETPTPGPPRPSNAADPGLTGRYRWVLECRQARRSAAQENWAEAAAAWSRAIELRPGDCELWKARGAIYEKLDQWDNAIADYRNAIQLEPQQWRFWKSQAENLARSGKLDRAAAIGASLVEHNPDNGTLWKAIGELHEASDQWDKAIADYQKAMELEPKQWPVWKARAEQFAQSKQWDKAIAVYTCLLKVNPADRALWQARATAHAALMQWGQAIHDYGEVIRLKPEDPSAWRQRGRAHLQLKAYDKAVDDFSQLVKLQPGDAGAWQQRAQASTRLEDYDQAITDFNEALRIDPKSFWGYVGRSEAYRRKMGDLHQAIADCNEAIRLDPKNSWGHAARAEVHLLMGDYDQAIADSSEAIRVIPLSRIAPCCWAYAYRAAAYLAKGGRDEAIADYNEAIRLAPEEAHLYALRAEGYLTLDRYDEALADSRKCVELASDQATAALVHAQILLAAGRTAEYRQTCAEMLERFSPSEDPAAWCDVARACALAPQAVPDPMLPVALAQRALASNPRERHFHALGAAHLRAGQLEEAARRFHESLKAAPAWDARSLNWLGLGLVHQARGETQEARQWLAQAADLMDRSPASGEPERLEGRILRHEAEQLLKRTGVKNETTEEDKDR